MHLSNKVAGVERPPGFKDTLLQMPACAGECPWQCRTPKTHLKHPFLAAWQPLRLCAAAAGHIRHQGAGRAVAIVADCSAHVPTRQLRSADAAAAELVVAASLVRDHCSAEAAGADHARAGWAGACTEGGVAGLSAGRGSLFTASTCTVVPGATCMQQSCLDKHPSALRTAQQHWLYLPGWHSSTHGWPHPCAGRSHRSPQLRQGRNSHQCCHEGV